MAVPRFFIPFELEEHSTIELPASVAHHALRVLRLGAGAEVVLFDGQGGEFAARLSTEAKRCYASLEARAPLERELGGAIYLAQGLAAGEKMDWIVEKAVELGVARFYPVLGERSVLRLSGARLEKRLQHWRAIIEAASEQCGRNRLMELHQPQSLARCLAAMAPAKLLCCHPEAQHALRAALDLQDTRLGLLVGPEAGWSDDELRHARSAGAQLVSFGPRVLRTETAGIALSAAVSAHMRW